MGQMTAEQVAVVVDRTSEAISRNQPTSEPTNYWWLLAIAVIPVFITILVKRKGK